MTVHHCTYAGCAKSADWPDNALMPPKGWSHIWTRFALKHPMIRRELGIKS